MDQWAAQFGIEKEMMQKLDSVGFNTIEVLKLLEPQDLDSIGPIGIGFRKKILHGVEKLKLGTWNPTQHLSVPTSNILSAILKEPLNKPQEEKKRARCTICHEYRIYKERHICSGVKCLEIDTCPTKFVRSHDPKLRAVDDYRTAQRRAKLNEERQRKAQEEREATTRQFLESEVERLSKEKSTLLSTTLSSPSSSSTLSTPQSPSIAPPSVQGST